MQERLRDLSAINQKWLFVTFEDIKAVPCFQNETIIAIKAPYSTVLEVPDPFVTCEDIKAVPCFQAVDYPQRRYEMTLISTMGPIDVYFISQFEDVIDEPIQTRYGGFRGNEAFWSKLFKTNTILS
ncbi:transcription factor E2FA-like isoform X1 [Coffea arabica]|uniref:Transcription factor E2FA-like isoform X1 n=2 Tax=Coffea arabica TaxID=13443 RepID=A0ABM4UKI3_COFAR